MAATADADTVVKESCGEGRQHFAVFYRESTTEEQRAVYDEHAGSYNEHYGSSVSHEVALRLLEPRLTAGPLRLLDAGCGTGLLGTYLRGSYARSADIHLVGVDYSQGMLDESAKTKAFDELLQRDFNAPFPLESGPVDAAVSCAVFLDNHVGPEAMVNIAEHVKPGGFFVLSVREKTYERIPDEYKKCVAAAKCSLVHVERADYKIKGSPFAYYLVLQKDE